MAGPRLTPPVWRSHANGVLLAGALATAAYYAAHAVGVWVAPAGAPPISPVLCAVLLGVIWRNVVGLDAAFAPGVQWIIDNLLRIGIALVGLKLTLAGLGSTVALAVPVVVLCVGVAIGVSVLVGRAFGLSQPLQLLLAAGTSVCGCTAICAVTPAVRARALDAGVAVSCVVVLGCVGMLLYPWLAHATFGQATTAAAVFLGTSIHDTSQVMGAAMIYSQQFDSPEAVAIAGFTKLIRNLSLLILLPLFAIWAGNTAGNARASRRHVLPAFLIALVLLAILRTIGDSLFGTSSAWTDLVGVGQRASDLFLVCGMTALGLNVSLADLRSVGAKALSAAAIVAVAVCATSLLAILFFSQFA